MSHRVKTEAELEQERKDEEFARQLQAQADAAFHEQYAQQQQQQMMLQQQRQHQQPTAHMGSTQVLCPVCQSLNNLQPTKLHLQHMCGTCHRVLPSLSSRQPTMPPMVQAPAPVQQQQQQQQQHVQVRCNACGSTNLIPTGATHIVYNCGTCRGALPPISSQQQQHAPPAPAPSAPRLVADPDQLPPNTRVLQGSVATQPQLHVRCGQCTSINVVPDDKSGSISFKCGACGSVNKVATQ